MSQGLFEHRELPEEGNPTPETVTQGVGYVSEFLASYGWYVILGILGLLYLYSQYSSRLQQWQQKRENNTNLSQYRAGDVLARQEALEKARQRMQEEHDAMVAQHAEKQKQREEEKRKEQIEDWERHKRGQGYRSKKLNKEDDHPAGASSTSGNQAKLKKAPLRQGYNPLMGDTGSAFRPARSSRSGGG
ncbi:selenoprotein S-like [Acanthaster planci]|uniref:Selenoprotein S-like n=1 Tax=Acanthaster planci TaxID=133434 RepID=A0A8B7Z6M6_ACAPL|nr:selenoprotein S-like [Acanthaster planci]XP_022101298.1 selenoprotein S-like [Acanthaster planci]